MSRTPRRPAAVLVSALALSLLPLGTAAATPAPVPAATPAPTPDGQTTEQPAPADRLRTEEHRIVLPGAELDATLHLPDAPGPAPAVLVAHGFGGSKASVDTEAQELADRGFVVLAWSARGFGTSTGRIALNAPDAEVADARALVDWLAARPDVQQDAPGDPRVGVTGGSYGGALSLLLAGYDDRIDALAPSITWNDLGQALFPNAAVPLDPAAPVDPLSGPIPASTPATGAYGADGVFKSGWAGVFFSAGLGPASTGTGDPGTPAATPQPGAEQTGPAGAAVGVAGQAPAAPSAAGSQVPDVAALLSPDGRPVTCGRFTDQVCAAYTEAATTGRLSPTTAELLRRSSPVTVTDRITAPTLLVQGQRDTLFGLDQADATARQIAAAGGPVKVIWYSGGHDGTPPGTLLREQIADWFDFHLAGRGEDPGTGFGYTVDSGVRASGTATQRSLLAPAYPGLERPGQPAADPVRTVELPLDGPPQPVLHPAGGNPAAITTLPGLGGALGNLGGRITAYTSELPGQSARFATPELPNPFLLTGSPRVSLAIARLPGQPAPAEAVLFAKTYEVSPDGLRTLLGGVAPFRIAVPADGTPAVATVALPAAVAPIEAGNRLVISVSTTDQGYSTGAATGADPAVWLIAPTAPTVTLPLVPADNVTASTVPLFPLIGIGVVLALAATGWLVATLHTRRRRRAAVPADPASAALPLRITDLAKTYRGGFSAVKEVSFDVRPGMVLGLLGPNGAGKTTVLRMLMGLITPTRGTITAFGEPVGAGAPVLARIGAFVEGPGFLPHLSGAQNLRLYWAATGRPAAEAHLPEALEIAGLGDSVHRRVGTYSQGMRQRLAIAQAMLGLPELLVLDEPTNGLDPPQIHAMRELLRRYAAGGRTVLVSSHLLAEVEQTCTHVVVMHKGRLIAEGSVDEIMAGGGAATFAVDAPERAAEVLTALAGVRSVEVGTGAVHAELNGTPRGSAVKALVTAGVDVTSAGPRRRLEDAFLELVGEDTTP